MALLLGRLAGAAAHHWKRSLARSSPSARRARRLAATGTGFTDDFATPGTESQRAYDLLSERFPAQAGDTATLVFSVDDGTLRDGDRRRRSPRPSRRSPASRTSPPRPTR